MNAERKLSAGFSRMLFPIREMAGLLKDGQGDNTIKRSRPLLDRALYYGSAPGPSSTPSEPKLTEEGFDGFDGINPLATAGELLPRGAKRALLALAGTAILLLASNQLRAGNNPKK